MLIGQQRVDFDSDNWRQNELRHFALNGLFDVFRTSEGEEIAFPPPSPPCNVVPLFELPLENKKHPNSEWRGQGRGFQKLPYLSTMSQQFCRRLVQPEISIHVVTVNYLERSFSWLTACRFTYVAPYMAWSILNLFDNTLKIN